MTQLPSNHRNDSEHNLSPAEQDIVENIRNMIHTSISQLSPSIAYELAQLLGLVSQIARTKDIDSKKASILQSATRSLFGKPDIAVPREELLKMLETAATILTESTKDNKADQKQRLVFAREILHQIDTQSRHFPNPMASLFKQYTSLEDRLLSGVVWFFSIFFVLPLSATIGLVLISSNSVNTDSENKAELSDLLNGIRANQEATQSTLAQISNDISTLILSDSSQGTDSTSEVNTTQEDQSSDSSDFIRVPKSSLMSIQQVIDSRLASNGDATINSASEILQRNENPIQVQEDINIVLDFLGIKRETFFSTDIFFILTAISMGALGGSVSVITASDRFLSMTKVKKIDPFYIGFFRPFVGMAFAVFVVALLESGVFSSILSIQQGSGIASQTRKVYLFAAIAFVAGFSERFAPGLADQVSRTPLKESESAQPNDDQ